VRIEPLNGANAPAWAELFEASGSSCFCRYWHFEGTKNDWLARGIQEPWRNRDEQLAVMQSGDPAGRGLIALEGDVAWGWMKLAPRALLPKLLRQGPYRSLALGPAEGIWSIGCLLVRPERRGAGVARALVRAAGPHVRAWGGRAIEAYPRDAGRRLPDEEAWVGTVDLFRSCGFAEIAGESPYPVMRRALEP
jgi:GNAT superfamily N-acetyltransferase